MPCARYWSLRRAPDGINPGCLSRGERLVSWLGLGFVAALLVWPVVALLWLGPAISLFWLFTPAAGLAIATLVGAPLAYGRSRRQIVAADYCLCLECRYPVGNLPPVGTCPECGSTYDHDQLRQTWRRTLDEGWRNEIDQ